METNEELIKGARAVGTNNVVANPRRYWGMIRELADALEAATTEWEYGMQDDLGLSFTGGLAESYDHATRQDPELHPFPVRRRAAGPWLPVEGESKS